MKFSSQYNLLQPPTASSRLGPNVSIILPLTDPEEGIHTSDSLICVTQMWALPDISRRWYFNLALHNSVFDAHSISEYNLKLTYLITSFALK
jgi:hypothetical protein